MVQSDHYPSVERLQNCILVPYQIHEILFDGNTAWEYEEHRIPDVGQPFGVDEHRAYMLQLINQDVGAYIYSHYDQGTQASFLALSIQSDEKRLAVQPVWNWVKLVMDYYYQKKVAITDNEDWATTIWDFSQFDVTDPGVQLSELI